MKWMSRSVGQAAAGLALAAIVALAVNQWRSDGVPVDFLGGPGTIQSIALEDWMSGVTSGSAYSVDVRSLEAYAQGHVAGAIQVDAQDPESGIPRLMNELPLEGLVVLYAADPQDLSQLRRVANTMKTRGFEHLQIKVYRPGWAALASAAHVPKRTGVEP